MASGVKDWRTGRMGVDKPFWVACILLGALLLRFGSTKSADAHIPGHEEWNDVLSASRNHYNGQCRGLGDAQLVEFDDWRRTIVTRQGKQSFGTTQTQKRRRRRLTASFV